MLYHNYYTTTIFYHAMVSLCKRVLVGSVHRQFFPHFVQGISGNKFPTPFAKPRGKGLSSPLLNTIWALVNIVIAFLLFQAGKVSVNNMISVMVLFAGFAIMSIFMSIRFSGKLKQ